MGKSGLVALLNLSSWCLVMVDIVLADFHSLRVIRITGEKKQLLDCSLNAVIDDWPSMTDNILEMCPWRQFRLLTICERVKHCAI